MPTASLDGLIPLSPGEIHLWLAYYDASGEPQLHADYRQLLDDAERMQEPRFYFARDRRRYLVTRVLARTVLSRYARVPPSDWVFTANRFGRPEIANPEAREYQISFNISHTHALIVLGVTQRSALGVDVEALGARKVSLGIADHYFAPDEVDDLAAVPSAAQQHRFFEYWTFKESYIKARGMGLSLPLDKFKFSFPSDATVALAIDPELADAADRWVFWQLQPTPEYLIAVCAERWAAQVQHITVRCVVPLVREQILASTFSRTSVYAARVHDQRRRQHALLQCCQ